MAGEPIVFPRQIFLLSSNWWLTEPIRSKSGPHFPLQVPSTGLPCLWEPVLNCTGTHNGDLKHPNYLRVYSISMAFSPLSSNYCAMHSPKPKSVACTNGTVSNIWWIHFLWATMRRLPITISIPKPCAQWRKLISKRNSQPYSPSVLIILTT